MKLFKSAEDKAEIEAGRQRLQSVAAELASASPEQAHVLAQSLAGDQTVAALSDKERQNLQDAAFTTYAETVLADDHLTEEEEHVFLEVADALAIPENALAQSGAHREIFVRLMVAKINDGRLEKVEAPRLITKSGEVVHAETQPIL